jgi:RNA polymerase sigma-70 factor (ECF subfamily)
MEKFMFTGIFTSKKSNRELFKTLYEDNFNYIFAFVFSRLAGDKEASEDIVQETFLAALKSLEGFKNKSSYKTWLCGIAKNKIINYYQRELKKHSYICIDEIYETIDTCCIETDFLLSEERKKVLTVLNNLPATYKYALILKYMDKYSIKEIAEILEKTPKAIDGILQRAKVEFKKEYYNCIGEDYYEVYR